MRRPAGRRGGKVELSGARSGQSDQFAYGLNRQRRMHDQHVGRALDQSHRREVTQRVPRRSILQKRREPHRAAAFEQRVTIGLRFGYDFRADVARAVLYDDRLPERTGDFLRNETREQVAAAADRAGDDAQRAERKILAASRACAYEQAECSKT